MIYDGTFAHENGENSADRVAIKNVSYNNYFNDAKYVGYMYGPASTTASTSKVEAQSNIESSTIKVQIENWYNANIIDKGLNDYVANTIYCNDRTAPGKIVSERTDDTGLGYGTKITMFGAFARFISGGNGTSNIPREKIVPTFNCSELSDSFTIFSNFDSGNGKLTYPVGLITADEVVAAGSGKYNTKNSNYYLYNGYLNWTLSPSNMYSSQRAFIFLINTNGALYIPGHYVSMPANASPVISLTPEYVSQMIGDGTIGNEYRVE